MKIRILYFAVLRERMGRSEDVVEVDPGDTVCGVARQLLGFDDCLLFAVNDEIVDKDYKLNENDQLVFIPPMAGG